MVIPEIKKVVASMATVPSRKIAAWEAILSLSSQVDEVHVYVNGCENDILRNVPDNVFQTAAPFALGDMGDAGKFYPLMVRRSVPPRWLFLTVDDDIIYPHMYASMMREAAARYAFRAAVGLHGKTFKTPVNSYYRDRVNVTWYHQGSWLAEDVPVHCLGTGCMAVYAPLVDVAFEHFGAPRNAADIHFAALCQQQRIPARCVRHPAGLLHLSPHVDHARDTIWAESRMNDSEHTAAINSITWKHF